MCECRPLSPFNDACVVVVVVSRYTLQASTFQMAILLQYNTEDSYTVQQLTDSTQIKTVSSNTALSSDEE